MMMMLMIVGGEKTRVRLGSAVVSGRRLTVSSSRFGRVKFDNDSGDDGAVNLGPNVSAGKKNALRQKMGAEIDRQLDSPEDCWCYTWVIHLPTYLSQYDKFLTRAISS